MNESIKTIANKTEPCVSPHPFTVENAKKAVCFHQGFPEYEVTPLIRLGSLSKSLGVDSIYIKDESCRFGLNAFKVLGGSYCMGRYIARRMGCEISELSFGRSVSDEAGEISGNLTFVTATDGNHGRGIAWSAKRIGAKCVVYMPKGSSLERLNHIRALGAEAAITDLNYDDTVRFAKKQAKENSWILMQDTAWEGYREIPCWIMQGYMTMAYEAVEQLNGVKPTHVFLQAGVGAMAGAVTGFLADIYKGKERPLVIIVEPDKADCIYRTAEAADGTLHAVRGNMNTIMAGLACGEPCIIGWNILRNYADYFISIPDYIAAKGMRILGNPAEGDARVISGESGAATLGLVAEALQNGNLDWLRKQLRINSSSRILCFSTEGDTDRENYRKIVWDGYDPSYQDA